MRALTLTQPFASGIKLVDNRPRRMIKREDFGKPLDADVDAQVRAQLAEVR